MSNIHNNVKKRGWIIMKNTEVNPQDFPESLKSMLQNFDVKALQDLKSSVDKEKLHKAVEGMVEMLKNSMSEKDHQSLVNLIDALKNMKKQ